ncbi:hypothetical protein BZA77DRAFT_387575 [Pyronema omphalodes]|nr:hypothetical protein BZA77DRAFT_387575 [Pyronema omphalodes]
MHEQPSNYTLQTLLSMAAIATNGQASVVPKNGGFRIENSISPMGLQEKIFISDFGKEGQRQRTRKKTWNFVVGASSSSTSSTFPSPSSSKEEEQDEEVTLD